MSKVQLVIPEALAPVFVQAQKDFDYHKNIHEFEVLSFKEYGKGLMKRCGLSPDAYMQMAFQLAQYKLHGHAAATYESTQTRAFAYGRTEVTRSCSVESLRWVKAMLADSRDPDAYKRDLLNEATNGERIPAFVGALVQSLGWVILVMAEVWVLQ